ncbi:hypothetical protein BH11CYA1_BH11CYA1_27940 [soil metagenome]
MPRRLIEDIAEPHPMRRRRSTISSRTTSHQSSCPICYFDSYGIDLRQFPKVLKLFDKEK